MRIAFLTTVLTHYRAPFHELVRKMLLAQGHEYILCYSTPTGFEEQKSDTVELSWAITVPMRVISVGSRRLYWQKVLAEALRSDLVVIGQENKLLQNYVLLAFKFLISPRIAYWGHGRNFQSRNPSGLAERWKKFWARKPDWWFAYTEATKHHLISLGYPSDKITVFNNSIDTSAARALASSITPAEIASLADQLGVSSANVAIFVGGLYEDKRLPFLIETARLVRAEIDDFNLIIVGAGHLFQELCHATNHYPWIKVVGPKFARDKAVLMMLAKVFLMPGLVGLAVLDAAASSLPVITTDYAYHSPEIAYLVDNVNGLVVTPSDDTVKYAAAVIALLQEPERLRKMSEASARISHDYSVEKMAEIFVSGCLHAISR